MPTIRLHIPEADLELFKRAAGDKPAELRGFILDAAEERARAVLAHRKRVNIPAPPGDAPNSR